MISLITIEQIWRDEQTRYWFNVGDAADNSDWCVADTNGQLQLLDSEGYPVEPCNDHGLLDQLRPYYEIAAGIAA